MKAFVFPGQGCQKEGMGKDLYENFPKARVVFEQANDILGERFSDFLFKANEEVLMDTRYTQMGIFVYECALAMGQDEVKADCVAGHSLGEYAALVVSGVLTFEEGVRFIKKRGQVFYDAFQKHPSAMGAIIGISEEQVQTVLNQVGEEDGEKLYFVAETKGTDNVNDLKGSEKKKIFCGRKHFEIVDTGIRYEVVKTLKSLKERV